jgi:hypothetical protein
LLLLLSVLSGGACALGLGDLRGQSILGEGLRLEADVLGEGKAALDPSCFRLVAPGNDDLPWLKKATLGLRRGKTVVLEIRSDVPLREPILQLAVQIGCGHEVVREYMVLASPARSPAVVAAAVVDVPAVSAVPEAARGTVPRSRPVRARLAPEAEAAWRHKPERSRTLNLLPDRLLLSSGESEAEPSLRLATELTSLLAGGREAKEAQREMLRLEFRMLLVMNEQATTQLETAEKLRNMEATLGELQQRAGEFSQRVEQTAAPVPAPERPEVAPVVSGAAGPMVGQSSGESLRKAESSGLSEWSLYGVLLGVFLGLGGWLGWRNFRERQARRLPSASSLPPVAPEIEVDPVRAGEHEGGVDFSLAPTEEVPHAQVDFELDASPPVPEPIKAVAPPMSGDSLLSMSATTVDEHFEANPVMELADIMLSFGRVKGAAQALQEYIDNNPQEALQPWIRLMDVYRMAGMRKEFESVARNLNQNFNVEIQQWEPGQPMPNRHTMDLLLDETVEPVESAIPAALRPESLEELPRLLGMVVELWPAGDVVGYLYQLLRDNRGGKRIGFSLPLVEEILFLIELKETSSRMEKEQVKS